MLDLGHGNVVMLAEAILQAAKNLPLGFQGRHAGKMEANNAEGNVDRRTVGRAAHDQRLLAATFSTRNASMMSPILMSLKFASPIPHS